MKTVQCQKFETYIKICCHKNKSVAKNKKQYIYSKNLKI